MDYFNDFIQRILSHEGGYVHNVNDLGGETKFGISKRSYPNLNIKDLTRDAAIEIYKRDFWERYSCSKLPQELAFQVLDAAINHGGGNAIRWLQRAAGVVDDGVIGPLSLAAVGRRAPADLVLLFNAERLEFYTKLSTWPSFGKGWTRRVAENLKYAAKDNG